MGIPRLTQHLLPFSDTVLLGRRANTEREEPNNIESIVIDGPSLVYHVNSRLLAGSDSNIHSPIIQPTCNEVSCGVMICLLQLTIVGVQIEEICFDGALPPNKREVRLNRLEKSRRKLEQFCLKTQRGFPCPDVPRNDRVVGPETVLATQSSPTKHNTLPENPFIVPAVFEDLKYRWSRENILNVAKHIMCTPQLYLADFPWADITVMVPGEADARCARSARRSNSAVLTNDSDLLLYDLGPRGSVVLLNSLYMLNWDPIDPTSSQVKSLRICPASVVKRLGIRDLTGLAYGLQNDPHVRLAELVRQTNQVHGQLAESPAFRLFVKEYGIDQIDNANRTAPRDLDARISELYWQYELREAFAPCQTPHVYLAILNEDHARRCAWASGLSFRTLAYSILNSSRPASERHSFISEYVRRGARIASRPIYLGDSELIDSQMGEIWARMNSIDAALGAGTPLPVYWIMFVLYEMHDNEGGKMFPRPEQLSRFLSLGYMGERLEWADIHLDAQILAGLYSLRILSQLLQTAALDNETAPQLRNMLASLPALHVMMRPASQTIRCNLSTETIGDLVGRFFQLVRDPACSQTLPSLTPFSAGPIENHKACQMTPRNIYDLLDCE